MLQDVGANPECGVGGEPRAPFRVIFSHRPHETQVTLLYEIEKVRLPAAVLAGYLDDEPQVGGDELLLGFLVIVGSYPFGNLPLLVPREDRVLGYLAGILS